MDTNPLDDLLDGLVAEYADRLAAGSTDEPVDLVQRVPEAQRAALERCLRMMRAGVAAAPRAGVRLGPGSVLDGYRILREIGRGGMSIVYLATQLDLHRQVALKVLRPGLALDGRHVDRFKREALSIARLQHAHIVQVYAVGEALGYHYLAMEYVEGKNLAQVLTDLPRVHAARVESERARSGRKSGDWTAADLAAAMGVPSLAREGLTYEALLAEILAPVARAIGVAHEIGLVHRDVKPSNILIHKDGRAAIADFGLAKSDGDPGLSLTGQPLGTPYYMSPEQAAITQAPVDGRTDVYSLGVTLYEALSGRRPFEGDTPLAVLDALRTTTPAPMAHGALSPSRDARALVERAMAREPGERYARVLDLASDLSALAQGQPTQAWAQVGGAGRRLARELKSMFSGRPYEYRSSTTLLGWPLIHVFIGPRPRGVRVARGWIAVGDVAIGGLAIGGSATGVLAFGGMASGGVCFGGIGVGAVSFGGVALGLLAHAGVAAGYAAVGGVAIARFACGGAAFGQHVITPRVSDPVAIEFFSHWMPWVRGLLEVLQ